MAKKPTVSQLHKKLWKIFSEFIRRRDADSLTGIGRCITCGHSTHWKKGHAGHYISRRATAIRYDERNVHLQCYGCNMGHSGRPSEYARQIISRYGKEIEEELHQKHWETKQFKRDELEEMIETYKEKLKNMDNLDTTTKEENDYYMNLKTNT